MKSTRLAAVIGTAAITAAGLAALAGCGTTTTKAPASAAAATPADPSYSYYQTMMGRLYGGGTMMDGGSYRWMTGATGYQWMMGGAGARLLPWFVIGPNQASSDGLRTMSGRAGPA